MAKLETTGRIEMQPTAIAEVKIIIPKVFEDHRGYFSETYNRKALEDIGLYGDFVQDNQSLSLVKGTVRGLHFQLPPFAQDKLVRVLRGSILDVAVDIRRNSETFGKHVTSILSAKEGQQIFVPIGFAHGFCTLEPNTEVFYKVTNYYSPEHDKGILWNDPDIGIEWPVAAGEAVLSENDRTRPRLKDLPGDFLFGSG